MGLNRALRSVSSGWFSRLDRMTVSARLAEAFFWGWLFLSVPFVWLGATWWTGAYGRAFVNAWLACLPGLYLLRLTLGVLFEWPLSSKEMRGHLLASRPFLMCLLAAWSATGVISSELGLLLSISPWGVILVGLFALFHSSAIWLIAFFPVAFWRNSTSLRASERIGIKAWLRKLWTGTFAPVLNAAREVFDGLRELVRRRT